MKNYTQRMANDEPRPMGCQEIADELGVSRQYISQTTKAALGKVYRNLEKLDPYLSPLEIIESLMMMFKIDHEDDVADFLESFPPEIKELVKEDARKNYGIRSKTA